MVGFIHYTTSHIILYAENSVSYHFLMIRLCSLFINKEKKLLFIFGYLVRVYSMKFIYIEVWGMNFVDKHLKGNLITYLSE